MLLPNDNDKAGKVEANKEHAVPLARYQCARGFTLIELIVTLTVVAILATVAVPQFSQVIQGQRVSSQVNEFVADINFARSEAIKRAANIGICPGTSTAGCSGSWNNGYVIFVDADGNNAWTAGETVLRAHDALASGYAITASSATTLIVFSSAGALSVTGTNPIGADTYAFCHNGVKTGKQVSLQSLGRASTLTTPPTGSC